MAKVIGVMGESGSGKTTATRQPQCAICLRVKHFISTATRRD